ncbi:MAG: excinuclease ABC subunit UvrB [Bacteroidales bacterium]|nr:excinuclease ABC subunit UvrB [Bacteroidales bacterium]
MGNKFSLVSSFTPTGDQPEAIEALVQGIEKGIPFQTLLGVTGSGKTFTIANVIERVQKPTLVLSHNKTLAAQLYTELKSYFPENAVEYFVSYYDYYQPEAYLPITDKYIEKDLSINEKIEQFRLRATSALLSGRRDVIIVSSVSCIYGLGNPNDFMEHTIRVSKYIPMRLMDIVVRLVDALYVRNDETLKKGSFRLRGDTLEFFPPYADHPVRIIGWEDQIEHIQRLDAQTFNVLQEFDEYIIYPASIFMTTREKLKSAVEQIKLDLQKQVDYFLSIGKTLEAKRLEERVRHDIEMLEELGYCSGIENYSRYFDNRPPGVRPYCLLDYFPQDYLMIIDESHVTIPQVRGMYSGDKSRKQILVDYGFRLPAALDNRPLTFDEFENLLNQVIFVSATPGDYEMMKCEGVVVEQLIRPTGIVDPEVIVRPASIEVDDLLSEIHKQIEKNHRTIVTTLTRRMAQELTDYLLSMDIKAKYLIADIDTIERIQILQELRSGIIDVVVGVNLLREGLDLPEVTLVAILDADKEGFLRDEKSLIQTAGRAARNTESRVILYADKITSSIQKMIDETQRRREKQLEYNRKHNIIPQNIQKSKKTPFDEVMQKEDSSKFMNRSIFLDPILNEIHDMSIEERIEWLKQEMEKAANDLNFMIAAFYRDEILKLQKVLKK